MGLIALQIAKIFFAESAEAVAHVQQEALKLDYC